MSKRVHHWTVMPRFLLTANPADQAGPAILESGVPWVHRDREISSTNAARRCSHNELFREANVHAQRMQVSG